MGNFFTITSLLTIIACVVLGCIYAWFLYGTNNNLNRNQKVSLAGLRILVISVITFLLFSPLVKQISYNLEKPIIIIAHDNSISVQQIEPIGFNQKQYQNDLEQLATTLGKKYEVKTYSFGDSVKLGLDFSGTGKLSNATALITQLNDELINRNVGAVIMASDGIFNRGGNPLYDLNKIKAPIYTIAMGDTVAKRDVLVANVNYNNLVYLDNEFTLDVQVQAYQSKGESTQLSIFENGKKVKEQTVPINGESFIKDVKLKLKANKIGVQKYTVAVSPVKNEITSKNNIQTIFVEVIDGRQKILLASASPHPDLAVIRQAIELNKHYQITLVLGDELNTVDPTKFSLAILYQLPSNTNAGMSLLSKLKENKIPLWYILGAQANVVAFNQMQKTVSLSRSNGSIQEVFPYASPNFTNFNIDANFLDQLNTYDPLAMPFGTLNITGNYSAVLNQRIGKINSQSPLWFFAENEGKKVGFLMGEGIWKWKLEEAKAEKNNHLVNELISKTVQYLAVKDDKRKFKVYASKSTYEENEAIVLNANLYNDAYEPINTAAVKVQIKDESGKVFNYTFAKFGAGYRLDAGNLPKGNYTFVASSNLGNKNYTASGAFFVNELISEYQQTTANHQLLTTMAQQTNGKMFMPKNLLAIADELEKSGQVKTISYEDRRYEELISFRWLFGMIMVLLTTEWFLRKRHGEA